MQQPKKPSLPPGRCPPRSAPRRTLLPYAALLILGTALGGCGLDPEDLNGSSSAVQTLDGPKCATETQGGPTSCKDEATWSAYGAMACAGKGLVLKNVSFAKSCGPGLYREATYDCCTSTTPVPTPTPPRMCMWAPAATPPGTCLAGDAWKKEGIAFCSSHGLQLNDLKLDRPCGVSGYSAAQFECCTASPPPPPPPPPPMCTAQALTERSCVDDGTWKSRIEATCKAKMQTVGSVSFGAACAGGHLEVKFECCGPTTPPPPPPPPPMCTTEVLTERSCVDDGTWKTRIEATCKAKMQSVGGVSFGAVCPGGHLEVKFECCGPTTPPPPPPPMCTTEAIAAMTCIDDASWKTRAAGVCASRKQTLGSLSYGRACM
ncbi:MAG TPA: hypothetical protein PLW65_11750, partial [Pseudomonadota bacterium]|nr:hypothetical protein [Pseudomonadota bacterium]